jgi:hypothetical protein
MSGKKSMKSMLIAAITVGATIAGLILYLEKKSNSRRELPAGAEEGLSVLPEDKVQPLAFHSLP